MVKPTRDLGEPGLFRLLPPAVLWVLCAPCWGRRGALLAVSGALPWPPVAPVGLSVGSFGCPLVPSWSPACCLGGLSLLVFCFVGGFCFVFISQIGMLEVSEKLTQG